MGNMDKKPFKIAVNGRPLSINPDEAHNLDIISTEDNAYHILKNNKAYVADIQSVDYINKIFTININGTLYTAKINDRYDQLIEQLGMNATATPKIGDIKAPMPGLVLEVSVVEEQSVLKGDKILILEAMKMENIIKAAGDGIVKSILIKKGNAVEKGQVLIEML
jgi:biotin carboxyl carrier protein